MRIASVSRVMPALLTSTCSAAVLLDDGVDQRLDRRAVVDVEHDAAAAGDSAASASVIGAAPASVVAVPMTLKPRSRQLERDRRGRCRARRR